MTAPLIGVLALQGGFEAHERTLRRLGARTRQVRVPADLVDLDGLVMPGGESTTMTLGIEREGLAGPLRELAARGTPILGSCAGLIMLDADHLGLMDMRAERNAFGRQIRSFEADVEILGELDGHAVAARQGRMLAVSFHTELSRDDRLHRMFLEWVGERRVPSPA